MDAELREDGQHGHGVCRRDERSEGERREHPEWIAVTGLARVVHDATDDEGGGEGADESEKHGGSEVGQEGLHVHVVARVEDDGRQQEHHEKLKVELLVRCDDRQVASGGNAGGEGAHEDADAGLWEPVYVIVLENVPEDERARERDQAEHKSKLDAGLLDGLLLGRVLLLVLC